MREQFAINLRESVELAKEHFSIMTLEHGERNLSSLIGMREEIQIEIESLENEERKDTIVDKDKNFTTSRSYSDVHFDALNSV